MAVLRFTIPGGPLGVNELYERSRNGQIRKSDKARAFDSWTTSRRQSLLCITTRLQRVRPRAWGRSSEETAAAGGGKTLHDGDRSDLSPPQEAAPLTPDDDLGVRARHAPESHAHHSLSV